MDEIRALSGQGGFAQEIKPKASGESFAETLKTFTRQVDAQIQDANHKTEALAAGVEMDLHDVVIATEKADLSFRLMLQIRNKVLEAYQEIMRLQI
jgi:flagellar hook-basal body complex protein FliE